MIIDIPEGGLRLCWASGFVFSDWVNKSTPTTPKCFLCVEKILIMLEKVMYHCFMLKHMSLFKHAELSFLARPAVCTHLLPKLTLIHPQMPSEVLNFKKKPKNFIWYQYNSMWKLSLLGRILEVLTAVFREDSRARPSSLVPVMGATRKCSPCWLGLATPVQEAPTGESV